MPRPVGYGRPGTRVIPDGWGAALAPALDSTRTATVSIREPGETVTWSDELERNVVTPKTPYASAVAARITALANASARASTADAAEELLHVAGYQVTVEHDLQPHIGDLVTVTAAPGDTLLEGRTLQVVEVPLGSERFERAMFCTLTD